MTLLWWCFVKDIFLPFLYDRLIITSYGNFFSSVNVRLGEWNYKNPDGNCASTNKGKVCLDEAINIGVESVIIHPAYTRGTKGKFNDIGLVRLKKDVEFKST